MPRNNAPFEIHVHGQIALLPEVRAKQVEDAVKPLWKYAGARSFAAGARSVYEDEPGMVFEMRDQVLQLCWTVPGSDDFRQVLDEFCMNLNEIAQAGAAIEVTFYDAEFDADEDSEGESRDDFVMLFVGPNPQAIMQVHGGGGMSDDFPLAYSYASARTLRFADGPDEVHRNAIAKAELGKYAPA